MSPPAWSPEAVGVPWAPGCAPEAPVLFLIFIIVILIYFNRVNIWKCQLAVASRSCFDSLSLAKCEMLKSSF